MNMTMVKLGQLSATDRAIYNAMPDDGETTAKMLADRFESMGANITAASISRLRSAGFITSRKNEHGREQLHTKQLTVLSKPQEHLVQRKSKAISNLSFNDQVDEIINRLELLKTSMADTVDIAEKARQFELLMKSGR